MIKKLYIIIIFIFGIYSTGYSKENCNIFKKLSLNFMKCKANTVKKTAISVGSNFFKDTKNFQNKEWSDEKEKINDVKKITKNEF
tara:strand:+ start:279 stop:533 length:255 start_codon:yes stop_codon:yes gene_type:complete